MARFCEGLAGVFERAVLRETLRRHRGELQVAIQWMSGRLSRMATETPTAGPTNGAPGPATGAPGGAGVELIESLTPRELEVLRLLARGQTNGAIAGTLLVREGTVKYHVKNILRKLGATSRADAVARYVRAPAPPRPDERPTAAGAVFSGPLGEQLRRRLKRRPPRRAKRWRSNQERRERRPTS